MATKSPQAEERRRGLAVKSPTGSPCIADGHAQKNGWLN